MAIQNARSKTAGSVPASLADGQIAINMVDEILFYKNNAGLIKTLPFNKLARIGFTPVADASYVIQATDRTVALTATLTASRTFTLPGASSVPAGTTIRILDVKGTVSPTTTLSLSRSGSDTVNGGTALVLTSAFIDFQVTSDGTSAWTTGIVDVTRGGTGVTTASGTALDNITAFSGTGLLQRTGAGAYGFLAAGSGATLDTISGLSGTGLLTRTGAATYSFTQSSAFASSGVAVTGAGGLTGGGALTGNQQLSVAANGVTNAMLSQMPTITVKGNITGGAANASDLAPSAILDAAFGTIQGTILARGASVWTAIGPGNAGQVLTSAGVGANPLFAAAAAGGSIPSASHYNVKTANYTATAADSGTGIQMTSSFSLTLGTDTKIAGWFVFVRKRDGVLATSIMTPPSGSQIDGFGSLVPIFQEDFILACDGTNYFTIGRQRGWISVGSASLTGQTLANLSITAGFNVREITEVEIAFDNLTCSNSSTINLRPLLGLGGIIASPSYTVETTGTSGTSASAPVSVTGSGYAPGQAMIAVNNAAGSPQWGVINARDTVSSVAASRRLDWEARQAGATGRGTIFDAAAGNTQNIGGINLIPTAGTLSSISYTVKAYRQ